MSGGKPTAAPVQGLLLIALASVAMLWPLMPLQLQAEGPVLPDVLFVIVMAWVQRRPDSAPLLLLAAIFVLADFVLGRPPGLWALICLLASEVMRMQAPGLRDRPFVVEWLGFAVLLAVALLAERLVLTLALVPQPRAAAIAQLCLVTVLAYPVGVMVLRFVFAVRAPRRAERPSRLGRVG